MVRFKKGKKRVREIKESNHTAEAADKTKQEKLHAYRQIEKRKGKKRREYKEEKKTEEKQRYKGISGK